MENYNRSFSVVAVFVTSAPCMQCFCHVYMLYVLLEHMNMIAELEVSPMFQELVKCDRPCIIFLFSPVIFDDSI